MVQIFKFFNSGVGDPRKYQAADFAEYFGSVLSTGLLHTDNVPGAKAAVEAGTMNTIVSPGKAIMKGHLYENTTPLTLTHSIPEPTLDRIDRVVLRLDLRNSERNILLHVKEGESATNPIAPVLQRDNFIHEISLAQIRVRKNTVQLLPTDLVDERLNEQLCGLVYSLISIPTDQLQAYINAKRIELDGEMRIELDDYLKSLAEAEIQLQTDLADWNQQWTDWFSSIQAASFVTDTEFNAHGLEFNTHKAEDATLMQKGHVQLSNAIDSVSEDSAATPNAVKQVYDLAQQSLTQANNGKTAVANAVTAKGVTASPADTFPMLATKIGQISTGKKSASGVINSSSTQLSFEAAGSTATFGHYHVTVSGLGFVPSTVLLTRFRSGLGTLHLSIYNSVHDGVAQDTVKLAIFNQTNYSTAQTTSNLKGNKGNSYVTGSGFRLPVSVGSEQYTWIAIE